MSFLWWAGFGFAASLPLLVLLYILKLKRKEFLVPSTFLWHRCVEDLRVNSPFQRLRKNLLLLLQLLVLLLLTLAVARPILRVRDTAGGVTILLVDCSASMGATDVKPNRLAVAKEAAIELIDAMKEGDQAMVISFAARATTVCGLTVDKGVARDRVESIELSDTRTGLREALLIAASAEAAAREQGKPCEVKLLSDGGFEEVKGLPIKEAFPVSYFPIGTRSSNVAITALEARKNVQVGESAPGEDVEYQLFVRVQNFMEQEAKARLLFSLNDRQIEVRDVTVPAVDKDTKAPGTLPVVFDRRGLTSGIVRVDLECADDLPIDNVAWTVLQKERDVNILVLTDENFFLKTVLNLDPKVHISPAKPADFEQFIGKGGGTGSYDLVCFDCVNFDPVSKWKPTEGSFWFLNCVPPIEGYAKSGEVKHPVIVSALRDHVLTRYVNFHNVDVVKAMKMEVPKFADTVLDSDEGPLITSYVRGKVRALVVHFNMYDSNWPLRYSFPMFVANAVGWLSGSASQASGSTISAGDVIRMVPERDVDQFEVIKPDGGAQTFKVDEDRKVLFAATERLGVYRMRRPGKPDVVYAVNLLDPQESDLLPRESFELGKQTVKGSAEAVATNKEYWWWLAAVAFGIVCVEWYVYNRRAW